MKDLWLSWSYWHITPVWNWSLAEAELVYCVLALCTLLFSNYYTIFSWDGRYDSLQMTDCRKNLSARILELNGPPKWEISFGYLSKGNRPWNLTFLEIRFPWKSLDNVGIGIFIFSIENTVHGKCSSFCHNYFLWK